MKDRNTGAPINQEEISHYLKDIRKIKVMTAEREKELAKKMKSDETPTSERQRIERETKEKERQEALELQQFNRLKEKFQ